MNVGSSVRNSFKAFFDREHESSMLHACNAIDGTASKRYPTLQNKDRFTQLLRDHYDILSPMATPSIDLHAQRWPVAVRRPTAPGGGTDLADLIYVIHRCTHGHGDELPQGFEFIPDVMGTAGVTNMFLQYFPGGGDGRVRLSDRIIFGLLAVAVMAPENHLQDARDDLYFLYGRANIRLPIKDWWGRAADFPAVVERDPPQGGQFVYAANES